MSDVPSGFGLVLMVGGFGAITIGGAVSIAAAAGAYMSRSLLTGIIATTITGIQTAYITTYAVLFGREGLSTTPWLVWVNLALTLAAIGWILGFWIRWSGAHRGSEGG